MAKILGILNTLILCYLMGCTLSQEVGRMIDRHNGIVDDTAGYIELEIICDS